MANPKLKMLTGIGGPEFNLVRDDETDRFDEREASSLIRAGFAMAIDGFEPIAIEDETGASQTPVIDDAAAAAVAEAEAAAKAEADAAAAAEADAKAKAEAEAAAKAEDDAAAAAEADAKAKAEAVKAAAAKPAPAKRKG